MPTRQNKFTLFIILLIAFIDWTSVGLVYPMFSSMLFEDGLLLPGETTSELQKGVWLGILLAAMPIAQFFSAPIVGALSDQKGRRPLLLITLSMTLIGYVLAYFGAATHHLTLLILSRLVIGIGAGNTAVVNAAIADISDNEAKVKNYGYLNMAYGVGFTLGPYLGGKLSTLQSFGGYAAPFVFAAITTAIALFLVLKGFKETHARGLLSEVSFTKGAKNFVKAFQNSELKYLFACVFIFCFGWSFYWEFIPVHWIKEYSFSSSQIGSLYAYAAGFYALSCGVLIKPISKIMKPPFLYFTGLIGLGIFIAPMLFDTSYVGLWIYIPLQQIVLSFLFPTATAMVSMWVKDNAQGEMLGALSSVMSSAFAFSPLVSGFFIGLSHWSPVWSGCCGMLFAAMLFYVGCLRKTSSLRSMIS